jgi:hypothetical protein
MYHFVSKCIIHGCAHDKGIPANRELYGECPNLFARPLRLGVLREAAVAIQRKMEHGKWKVNRRTNSLKYDCKDCVLAVERQR